MGEGGVKNPEKYADVFYFRSHRSCSSRNLKKKGYYFSVPVKVSYLSNFQNIIEFSIGGSRVKKFSAGGFKIS